MLVSGGVESMLVLEGRHDLQDYAHGKVAWSCSTQKPIDAICPSFSTTQNKHGRKPINQSINQSINQKNKKKTQINQFNQFNQLPNILNQSHPKYFKHLQNLRHGTLTYPDLSSTCTPPNVVVPTPSGKTQQKQQQITTDGGPVFFNKRLLCMFSDLGWNKCVTVLLIFLLDLRDF